ncbi:hypothetical protein [Mycobacterium arosiense]|uniref:Uncharacterized protein n=1 Tax=Mycobacterium arosiense ATCC BAA-1401 = DSM 45069 TaxID=1265311 RepID=A0A1W9Z5X3_MYCAI|nr:hypothetical protein [Mycobacterium arosiense]ORA07661.1 hypothetical protein BST14_26880 [Mycobacterium arosiense ATCC BAA-1401 = DSM 45069]
MIDMKRAVFLLPVYIAAMIAVDIVFKSAHVNATKPLPVWTVAGFIGSAIIVVAVGIWYFTQRRAGKVTQKREHAYIAVMAGVMVSGFVGDALSDMAGLFMGGKSLWVMAPSYALAYIVLLWTTAFTAKVLDNRAGNIDDRSGSPRA